MLAHLYFLSNKSRELIYSNIIIAFKQKTSLPSILYYTKDLVKSGHLISGLKVLKKIYNILPFFQTR